MVWQIEFTLSAEREFAKLPKDIQKKVLAYLKDRIIVNPRLYGKALVGNFRLWRYRINDYRLICQIDDTAVTVIIVRIAKRDEVY